MRNWRHKEKSLREQFEENPKQLISHNSLFRTNIIPHHPLEKNLFILINKRFNKKIAAILTENFFIFLFFP